MRAWRHPSEIAAAQAAALRDLSPPPANRLADQWSLGSFFAGGALGALVTLAALISGTSLLDRGPASRVEFRTEEPTAAVIQTTLAYGSSDNNDGAEADSAAGTGSTMGPGQSARSQRWSPTPEPGSGVVSISQLDGREPIATGILVNGVLVTSSSALGGAERVLIHSNGTVQEVLVRGSDEFADLAVLVPLDPLALGDGFVIAPEPPAEQSQVHLIASDGKPQPIIVEGHLLSVDQRAVTRNGHTILDAMHTSARVPELGAGAALLNDDGQVVGMVIDVEDYLAVALPAARIIELTATILASGWPDPAWVGIEGTAVDGGVVVTELDAEGPAARSGLNEGDLITRVGESPVIDVADLVKAVRIAGPGATVDLRVVTDGNDWTAHLVVGKREPRDSSSALTYSD